MDNSEKNKCMVCNGKGKIRAICENCNGGKVLSEIADKNVTNALQGPVSVELCYSCDDDGFVQKNCNSCNGSGIVT